MDSAATSLPIGQAQARGRVPVVWAQRPFVGPYRRREFDVALRAPTIAEIVASIPPDELPRGFAELGEVQINGDVISRGVWHLVRPRHRPGFDTVVSLHVPLGDHGSSGSSGSSGKSSLALVASIAVLLVASFVSAGGFGFGAIGILSAGVVNALAGSAIGIGGPLEPNAKWARS